MQERISFCFYLRHANVGDNVGDNVGVNVGVELTERQLNIVKLIRENPIVTVKEMSVIMSVNKRTIERDLTQMKSLGILKREGSDKNGVWVVINGNK